MFFAVFAIRPTLLTMSDLIKEIDDKKTLDQALTQKVAALSTGQNEYLTLQSRLVVLDEALPPDPKLVEALKIIEKVASDNSISISSLGVPKLPQVNDQIIDPNTSPTLTRQNFNFTVNVVSDYANIRTFVAALQATQRMIIVESINFTINEELSGKALEANVNINMPYFGAAPAAGATP